jgi:hypothetical protein
VSTGTATACCGTVRMQLLVVCGGCRPAVAIALASCCGKLGARAEQMVASPKLSQTRCANGKHMELASVCQQALRQNMVVAPMALQLFEG